MDTFQETREILKELAISQKETKEMFKDTDAKFKDTDAKFKETDAELSKRHKETQVEIKELRRQMGDLGHSNGEHAEAMFYDSLAAKRILGGIKYDAITKNLKKRRNRTEDEYDIFLENGSTVGIIEVKYKVQKKHIDKLLTLKKDNFRILFPEFSTYKLYMGIAGLSFESDTEEYAADNGLIVLKNKGKHLEINSKQMVAF